MIEQDDALLEGASLRRGGSCGKRASLGTRKVLAIVGEGNSLRAIARETLWTRTPTEAEGLRRAFAAADSDAALSRCPAIVQRPRLLDAPPPFPLS